MCSLMENADKRQLRYRKTGAAWSYESTRREGQSVLEHLGGPVRGRDLYQEAQRTNRRWWLKGRCAEKASREFQANW